MALKKKKAYKFSDEVLSRDAGISLLFGVCGLILILYAIVYSVLMKGEIPLYIGGFLLASAVMALTALIFGLLSYRDQDGGVLTKRASVIISVIDILLLVMLYFI